MTLERKYKGKDSEMLVIASTILQAAVSNKDFLITKRPTWTDVFYTNLETRINNAISTYLGVDNASNLRRKTAAVYGLQASAYAAVSDVKLQIAQDFKNQKEREKELLTTLGYSKYWLKAQAKDQESLISLLFAFKQNLTPEIRTELTTKGINPAYLDTIIDAAQQLLDANVSQEYVKKSSKEQTNAAITEFNAIYDEIIAIAGLSRRFFKDTVTADQFSYDKALKALNAATLSTKLEETISIQPGTLFSVSKVKLTRRSLITLTLLDNLDGIYVCRNTNGCYPSDSKKLMPNTALTFSKADLQGEGNYLLISNPQSEIAQVLVKIQG